MASRTGWWVRTDLPRSPWTTREIQGRDGFGSGLLAEDDARRIAGRQVDEREDGNADQEGDRRHQRQPPHQVLEQ
jgi:hypothetical protein